MKKYQRPTIFDLVKYTGISRGTISRAFNDQAGISQKTRTKILKAAEEIGYRPHNGARMMKLGRTGRWGLLLPHLQNAYYPELVEALNNEAHQRGTTLLLGLSNFDQQRESNLVGQWTAGEVDGLVLDQAHYHANPELFEQLKSRGVPILFLHGTPIPGFDFIRYDLYPSFRRILKQLDDLGHEEIGYVGQEFPFCRQTSRFRAYAEFHETKGRKLDERLIYFGKDGTEGGIEAFKHWKAKNHFPSAVVCCDDSIACGLIYAARSSGFEVPRDISVTGVDDIAEAARIRLTTIHTSRTETARTIIDLLERRLNSKEEPPEVRYISSDLILRDSIGRPPKKAAA